MHQQPANEMANYSPNEFLYARPLANALQGDKAFRHWFLADTKFAAIAGDAHTLPELQASLRTTPTAEKWWWFNHFCRDICSCKVATGLETDVFMVFEVPGGFRFAIHVEVKPPGKKLGQGQAESYPRRAACWANPATRPRTVLAHDGFATILVCGDNLKSDARCSEFDKVVFHRNIEERLSPYPALTDLRNPAVS